MRLLCILAGLVFSLNAVSQPVSVKILNHAIPSGIRAMSAVDDQVVWISGSKGYVARSTDGGTTFTPVPVPGEDSADFRALYAFDATHALVACTGSPAKVYYTANGTTWTDVYVNNAPEAFIDGIDFWNDQEGMIYGDPIDGQLMLLRTTDGGKNWEEVPEMVRPMTVPGEASFAASGTAIRCFGEAGVIIATGGTVSRLLLSDDKGDTWSSFVTPILQGKASTGIFSVDLLDDQNWVIVGGDYLVDSLCTDHIFFTNDGGNSWQKPVNPTRGFREGVAFLDKNTVIAVGPGGADISTSGCRNWEPFSDVKGLHVVRKSRAGHRVFVAGKNMFGVIGN